MAKRSSSARFWLGSALAVAGCNCKGAAARIAPMYRLISLLAFALVACAPSATVTMLLPISRPAKDPEQVKIWMGSDVPDCPYETVGRVSANAGEGSHSIFSNQDEAFSKVIQEIRVVVAKVGADGVFGLQTAAWGTVQAETQRSSGSVYVCK